MLPMSKKAANRMHCDLSVALRWMVRAALSFLFVSTIVFTLNSGPFDDLTLVIPSANASVCHNMPLYLRLAKEVVLVHGSNSPPCEGATNVNAPHADIGAANRFVGANYVKTPLLMSLDNDWLPYRWSLSWMRSELLQRGEGHVGNIVRRCDETGYWPNIRDAEGHDSIVLTGMSIHYSREMRNILKRYYENYANTLRCLNGNGEDILYNQHSAGYATSLTKFHRVFLYQSLRRKETDRYYDYHFSATHASWRSSLCRNLATHENRLPTCKRTL